MGSRVIVGKFRLLSGEDGFDDLPVDVGEAVVTALKFIGQLLVIEAEEVEDGGLEVAAAFAFPGLLKYFSSSARLEGDLPRSFRRRLPMLMKLTLFFAVFL